MVPGKQPVRGLPRPAPDCGHYALPSTPFRHQHPEDSDMDSEIAQGTRAPSPASPVDAATIASPRSETVEACDCAQPPDAGRSTSKKRLLAKNESMLSVWKPALTLENSGSVARDHLASERTFLAYVRTSLTIASTGVGTSASRPFALAVLRPVRPTRQRSSSSSQSQPRRRTKRWNDTHARSVPSSSVSASRHCCLASSATSLYKLPLSVETSPRRA